METKLWLIVGTLPETQLEVKSVLGTQIKVGPQILVLADGWIRLVEWLLFYPLNSAIHYIKPFTIEAGPDMEARIVREWHQLTRSKLWQVQSQKTWCGPAQDFVTTSIFVWLCLLISINSH
jgi:hypothetical protein